jgi:hypothetical protein
VEAVRSFLQLRQGANAIDIVSVVLFNDGARSVCTGIPLADCLARLGELLQMHGGGTTFGPALSCAHGIIAKALPQAEYLPLLMFMSDGCCGTSDGETEMVSVLFSRDAFRFQFNGLA